MKRPELQPEKQVRGLPHRVIYTANYQAALPGEVARVEGQPPVADAAVNEAYDQLGLTYRFLWESYGRDSLDDRGMALSATVHYEKNYSNAFWNGKEMVIGDGDAQVFNRFSRYPDVIAKELAKGMIEAEAQLPYWGDPGALMESISDVFGVLVKQYALQQTASQADWLVGAGLFTDKIKASAIRSLQAPGSAYDDPLLGRDPQPAHMDGYVDTDEDNGGVHINSGIPNHAFYLIALQLGGYAWEKAGRIWYVTLTDKLKASSSFQDCANLTHQTAGELYGVDSVEQQAVRQGWAQVGITIGAKPKGKSPAGAPAARRKKPRG